MPRAWTTPTLIASLCALALQGGALAASNEPAKAATPIDLSPVAAKHGRSALPEGWQHGAFMEVFVRGYQDSDGDGIGDLRGLTARLDYLKELGIKGLWLMPIQASTDHDHGYATADHRRIEPQYGTMEDFDTLIREAHQRGIGVVMDYILNHSAAGNPMFQAALKDEQSGVKGPWRDWFVWTTAPMEQLKAWDIWGKTPWYLPPGAAQPADAEAGATRYFAVFGADMPDFNMRNPAVVRYHEDSLRFWLNRGLDGYRLDAVPHLIENNARDWNDQPESRALTGAFTKLIHSYPRRYVVCEATAEPREYAKPEICGSSFAFGLERAVIEAAKGDEAASAAAVKKVADFFVTAPLSMATMLSNHDIFAGQRAMDQFDGDEARYRLAAATYLLLPGTPFIYYGEEIGQRGVVSLPGDEPLRAPMSWTAAGGFTTGQPFRPLSPNVASHNAQAQLADPGSLLNFYKAMLALRNQHPSIARGSYEAPIAQGQVLSFQRALGKERTLVVMNYGTAAATLTVPALPKRATLSALHPKNGAGTRADATGSVTLSLPPQSVQVFRLR